jgi:hypothetical protein
MTLQVENSKYFEATTIAHLHADSNPTAHPKLEKEPTFHPWTADQLVTDD